MDTIISKLSSNAYRGTNPNPSLHDCQKSNQTKIEHQFLFCSREENQSDYFMIHYGVKSLGGSLLYVVHFPTD